MYKTNLRSGAHQFVYQPLKQICLTLCFCLPWNLSCWNPLGLTEALLELGQGMTTCHCLKSHLPRAPKGQTRGSSLNSALNVPNMDRLRKSQAVAAPVMWKWWRNNCPVNQRGMFWTLAPYFLQYMGRMNDKQNNLSANIIKNKMAYFFFLCIFFANQILHQTTVSIYLQIITLPEEQLAISWCVVATRSQICPQQRGCR